MRRCLAIYAGLIAFLVLAAVVVRFVPAGPLANALNFPVIASMAVAGLIGVFLVDRAGFPRMIDERVTRKWRVVIPSLTGAAFGAITIVHAKIVPGGGPVTPFPVAILVFAAGAILLEIMLRLFGVTIPTALLGLFGPRARIAGFWIAAVLTSLYEPMPFLGHGMGWSAALIAARLFAFNLIAAIFYRRAGFLAPLSERWSEYLIWHIVGQALLGLR